MTIRNLLLVLLIASIFSLSGAFVYFALQIKQVSLQIPAILSALNHTNEKVDRALTESKQLRSLASEFTDNVASTAQQIPLILAESERIRGLVPIILDEAAATNANAASAITVINETNSLVPSLLIESAEIRNTVPKILKEIEITRATIPEALAQLQGIVASMDEVGKTTTEGVLTGVVSGTLKTPFRILESFGKAVFGDNEEGAVTSTDIAIIRQVTYRLLDSAEPHAFLTWSNPESDNYGVIKLLEMTNESNCKTLSYQVSLSNSDSLNKKVKFCKNEEGWQHEVL